MNKKNKKKKLETRFDVTVPERKSAACTHMADGGNKMFLMRSRKCSLFHFTLIFGCIIWFEKKKKERLGSVQLVLQNGFRDLK